MSLGMMSKVEIGVWVGVLVKDKPEITAPEIMSELTLINRLLLIQKNYQLMSRKRNLKTQLEAVIGQHLGHTTPNLNVKDKKSNIQL